VADHISIYCPHCRKHTALTPAPVKYKHGYDEYTTRAFWQKSDRLLWWLGVCNACEEPVLVLNDGVHVFPTPLPAPTDKAIPTLIRADLDEAKQCFALGAFRACAVMARRAMQSAAMDKGASSDKLVKQIDELAVSGKITADLKEWAHAVRWAGNDAAHPGGVAVERDDAEDVLHLAEQFLHVLYVAPSRAAGLKKRLGK
jgi:hypothetical protein